MGSRSLKKRPSDTEFQLMACVFEWRHAKGVKELFEERFGRKVDFGTILTSFRRVSGWLDEDFREVRGRNVRVFRINKPGRKAFEAAKDRYLSFGQLEGV